MQSMIQRKAAEMPVAEEERRSLAAAGRAQRSGSFDPGIQILQPALDAPPVGRRKIRQKPACFLTGARTGGAIQPAHHQ